MSPRPFFLLLAILALPALVQADADEKVNAAIKVLVGGKDAEKVQALKDLAAMGEDGKPAARVVAVAMNSKNKDIQKHAIDAFGKIEPEALKPALRLLLEKEVTRNDFDNLVKASNKAAIPLIRGRIDKDIKAKNLNGINEGILALAEVGIGDDEATDSLIRLSTYKLEGITRDYRDLAVGGLAIYAGKASEEQRERIVVGLDKILATQQRSKKARTKEETTLCIAVLKTLSRFGKDGSKATGTVKALRLDKDSAVRDAAIDALKAIGGGVTFLVCSKVTHSRWSAAEPAPSSAVEVGRAAAMPASSSLGPSRVMCCSRACHAPSIAPRP